jgi:hypothetical protein
MNTQQLHSGDICVRRDNTMCVIERIDLQSGFLIKAHQILAMNSNTVDFGGWGYHILGHVAGGFVFILDGGFVNHELKNERTESPADLISKYENSIHSN